MTEGSLFAHALETHWVDHVQTAISYHPHYVAVRLHWGGGANISEVGFH